MSKTYTQTHANAVPGLKRRAVFCSGNTVDSIGRRRMERVVTEIAGNEREPQITEPSRFLFAACLAITWSATNCMAGVRRLWRASCICSPINTQSGDRNRELRSRKTNTENSCIGVLRNTRLQQIHPVIEVLPTQLVATTKQSLFHRTRADSANVSSHIQLIP